MFFFYCDLVLFLLSFYLVILFHFIILLLLQVKAMQLQGGQINLQQRGKHAFYRSRYAKNRQNSNSFEQKLSISRPAKSTIKLKSFRIKSTASELSEFEKIWLQNSMQKNISHSEVKKIEKLKQRQSLSCAKRKKKKIQFWSETYQGLRDYNEDRIAIKAILEINKKEYSFFAIFDGHGGSSTAEYLKIHLLRIFEKKLKENNSVKQSLLQSLAEVEYKILQFGHKIQSGSCAVVCVLHESNYCIANVGDSRILKIQHSGNYQQITRDHKPEDDIEMMRVEKEGGRIYRNEGWNSKTNEKVYGPCRIDPSKLSVSRTIGDNQYKKKEFGNIISSTPDIFEGQLKTSQMLIMMSDGGYEQFSNSEISNLFFCSQSGVATKVKRFIKECKERSTFDNVSIVGIEMMRNF